MDKDRRKANLTVNLNFWLSIVSTLILLYTGYVIKTLEGRLDKIDNKMEKQYDFITICQNKIGDLKEIVSAHLAWHVGKKEIREEKIR